VLLFVSELPNATIADIAGHVGISRRSAQMIVTDLAKGGYLTRQKVGRRNRYSVNAELPMRHPSLRDRANVGALLGLLDHPPGDGNR
jgi:hypothetical protein